MKLRNVRTGADTGGTPPRHPRALRRTGAAVRAVVSLHTVAILGQPLFAGLYLGGDYDALGLHRLGADATTYLAGLQLLLTLTLAALGGVRWPLAATTTVVAGETGQYLAGAEGLLALHIPLGVSLVGAAGLLFLTVWWRPLGARRPQPATAVTPDDTKTAEAVPAGPTDAAETRPLDA
ncbi:hypothetical protein DSC45_10825 [Streptomyces sp. YIM 130001]|uniref:hypothetical protein n=1 Tax=Streptomyces sp. YIM 130001 TaxID=2259644 RepID=UPI000EC9C30D|nr:hypothetical protein [Streptomyces sp. YIM 130001]RII18402.1 hypothetical protein DSC45_10825 [Streptomyces sp. YIM 130001]